LRNEANRQAVEDAWVAWTAKFQQPQRTYRDSDRYRPGCALDDVANLVAPLSLLGHGAMPPPPPAVPVAAIAQPAPQAQLSDWESELMRCAAYACNDVIRYPGNINPSLTAAQQEDIKTRKSAFISLPRFSNDIEWSEYFLKQIYMQVNASRAGECTSYAYYAAHVLRRWHGAQRIEIVSCKLDDGGNHLFCLADRIGAVPDDRKIPRDTITAAVRVIDCWLLSLGWPQAVYTIKTFPWPDMLNDLTCEMDSNRA
jgi:hypothetical protein